MTDGSERPEGFARTEGSAEPDRGRTGRRWLGAVLIATVVVAAAAGVTALSVARSGSSGYSDQTRQRFMAACTADGGAAVDQACGCLYLKLSTGVPYDRFAEVDRQLRAAAPDPESRSLPLPSDVAGLVESCRQLR